MSDADDFEADSAVTGRDARGPPSTDGGTASPVADGLLTARRVAALLGGWVEWRQSAGDTRRRGSGWLGTSASCVDRALQLAPKLPDAVIAVGAV
jgi:hypothetical protein